MQPQLIGGRYQVLRAIGRGGMGTVWLCRDEVLGREVAVKQIGALPGDSASETKRAMREARSAAALNHPNAVAVYDVVDHESRPWLVMEYVEGETLADEILREGLLSPQRVADVGSQLAGALARAHQRRIVHRDIKPGNVLIDKAGRPKISDFGIARGHGDEQLTQVGFITGTPGYLSPELARGGDPHPASDVWALGATLYAAVEGQPPYEPRSNPIALLRAISTERPRPMIHAGVLAPAIDAMMHEDPACRWDMATSARRLGGIARAAALAAPRVDPTATKVMAAPVLDSTQALAPTQRVEAAPVVAAVVPVAVATAAVAGAAASAPTAKLPEVATPIPSSPVQNLPGSKAASVGQAPIVAKPPAAVPPVVDKAVVASPVVDKPLVAPPVVDKPLVAPPVAVKPAVAAPAVAAPAVVRRAVTTAPVIAAPVATKSPVVGVPTGGTVAAPRDDKGSRRRWIPLGLVALLVVALGSTFVLTQLGDPGARTATPVATRSTAPAKPAETSAPAPSVSSPAPIRTTVAPAAGTDAQLVSFVTSYYANVTHHRDSTWTQLSPRMQGFAGGRSSYDGFWKSIRSVRVNSVQANAVANTAVVDLTFTNTKGITSTETHNFTFLRNGAGYLIQTDR